MRRLAAAVVLTFQSFASAVSAQVDEEQLQLMRETTSYTDVADAADGDDPFDLNLHFGFSQRRVSGDIRREALNASGGASFDKIGTYRSTRNVLDVGLDLGVYHDLAVTVRLPVILSDSYTIRNGSTPSDVMVEGGTDTLFSLPFDGPTRSGLDTVHVGIMWGPLNQNRVHEVPSWVILADLGIPIGDLMRPCNPSSGTSCNAGISRGNLVAHFETRISRRHRYVEPYVGLGATAEIPTRSKSTYRPVGDLRGYQHILPPFVGDFVVGAAFIPWENLPRYQRFVVDLRATGSYVSNGRDYSPLYDALGTSGASGLTSLNCEDGGDIATCPAGSAQVAFNGLTDTLAYGRIGGRVAIEIQAARYITFNVGSNISFQTAHSITSADVCNANVTNSATPRPGAVDCVDGVYNPHYRDSIDEPGRRFEVAGSWVVDLFARAVAQF